jgi:hypothetical protein
MLLFAAVVIGVLVAAHLAARRRRRELAELAASLGLAFEVGPDEADGAPFARFEVFRRGRRRLAYNTISGSYQAGGGELMLHAGDFRYTTGSGKSKRTHRFSYLVASLPWPTPELLIRPEGIFDKLAAAFGFDDIDFESSEFSHAFYVKGSDKRFAYALLDARMMEFLLRERPKAIDIESGEICFTDGARKWPAAGFRAQLDFLRRFLDQWPRHLVKELASSG